MKALYKYLFCLLILLLPVLLNAQEEVPAAVLADDAPPAPKQYYVLSPRVSVTVPHPSANRSFTKTFAGIYEISGGVNVYLIKGVFAGITYKNALLKITANKIPNYEASMHINNAGFKLGGDFYVGDKNKIIYSAALSAGKNWTNFQGLTSKNPSKIIPLTYICTYIEPEMNLFFLIESNFGIGVTVSYSIFSKNFDPYELSLNDWSQYGSDNTGKTQYFSFGFGFYYSLIHKKGKHKGGY